VSGKRIESRAPPKINKGFLIGPGFTADMASSGIDPLRGLSTARSSGRRLPTDWHYLRYTAVRLSDWRVRLLPARLFCQNGSPSSDLVGFTFL